MSGAVFWLIVAASTNPFVPGKIGPMTEERCLKAAEATGGECKRQIGTKSCIFDGKGTMYPCPLFEGDAK
jgi:hypothetical protein